MGCLLCGILIDVSLISPENMFLWLDENQYSKWCSLCQFVVGADFCENWLLLMLHALGKPACYEYKSRSLAEWIIQSPLAPLSLSLLLLWAVLGRGRFPVKLRRPRPRVFPSLPMPASRPESDTCCCVTRRKSLQPPQSCLHLFPLVFKVAPVEPIWGTVGNDLIVIYFWTTSTSRHDSFLR